MMCKMRKHFYLQSHKSGKRHKLFFQDLEGYAVAMVEGSDGIYRAYEEEAILTGIKEGLWDVYLIKEGDVNE